MTDSKRRFDDRNISFGRPLLALFVTAGNLGSIAPTCRLSRRRSWRNELAVSMLAIIGVLLLSDSPCRGDTFTVMYHSATGYIESIHPGRNDFLPPGSGRARCFVSVDSGSYPDQFRFKVDLGSKQLVSNDRLVVTPETLVLRAGTEDSVTVAIEIRDPSGALLVIDSTRISIRLIPVVDGRIPVLAGAWPKPHARFVSNPNFMEAGCVIVGIGAAEVESRDVLLVEHVGIEPIWLTIRHVVP